STLPLHDALPICVLLLRRRAVPAHSNRASGGRRGFLLLDLNAPSMSDTHFDLVVLGGGMAGLPIANKAAYKGLRTALVERDTLGGTCLNRGCIPTKTMIVSARAGPNASTAGRFVVRVEGDVSGGLASVVRRKDEVVRSIRENAYRQVARNERRTLFEA